MRVLAVLALSACSFTPGTLARDGGGDDVPGDDAPDGGPPGCEAWQARHFMPCAIPQPMGGLTLTEAASPYTYVTTTGVLTDKNATVIPVATMMLMQAADVPASLVSVGSLTVETGAVLDLLGDHPLIVASWGPIALDGTIDAASRRNGRVGSGGGAPALCVGPQAAGNGDDETTTGGGSGGGGGGGFRGAGGMGGPGDTGGENPGGIGGGAVTSFPTIVRGGCSGARSGTAGPDAGSADLFAAGGAGGGAVQLSARTSIAINDTARAFAGGAGGEGTPDDAATGGGGGGAGGYLGFEAPTIVVSGAPILAANGGGGGGSNGFANPGDGGQNGQLSDVAAMGGAASSCSNAGGDGAAAARLDGESAAQTNVSCGGGAGGGGAGFIAVFAPEFSAGAAVISPAHQLNPF